MKKIVHFTCYDVKQFGLESKFAVILAIGRSVEGVIGQFQKISILYHGRLLGFPKGRGGSQLWNSEGMGGGGVFTIGNPKAWGNSTGQGFLE